MAACGSLQHIFENPLPESPTLLESLSPWKAIKSLKPVENSSFTEIFGELHFKENQVESSSSPSSSSLPESFPTSSSSSSSSSSLLRPSLFAELKQEGGIERLGNNIGESTNNNNERSKSPTSGYYPSSKKKHYKHSDSFSSMNSESLSLCTEGLGFESCDDVEDLGNESSFDFQQPEEKLSFSRQSQLESAWKDLKRSRTNKGSFPPPISCISRTGKPWVCFQSFRQDGRFILQEIRFPTQEFLHACREDGRLRLQYIQSDDEILEGTEEEDEEEDDASEDIENVNDDKIVVDFDDYHGHHQEHNNDAQDDADKGVQMSCNNVEDS